MNRTTDLGLLCLRFQPHKIPSFPELLQLILLTGRQYPLPAMSISIDMH